MNMGAEQARLWQALGLGPRWRIRAAASGGVDDAAPRATPAAAGGAVLDWDGLERTVAACTACGLCQTRTQTVFGVGSRTAQWLFIGEAPGAEEDARGEPFVGQAGRLLDNMLAAAGLGRAADRPDAAAVFIANVLKCRPPGNRNPEPAEVAACAPFLQRQVALLQPRVIVVMGRYAAQALLQTDATIGSLRGRVHEIAVGDRQVPVVVTYHPAYLLRNLAEKARSWEDLCLAQVAFQRAAGGASTTQA